MGPPPRIDTGLRRADRRAVAIDRAVNRLALLAATTLLVSWTAVGCAAADLDEPAACRCEIETCSPQSCGFRVQLDAACAEHVDVAEVLIDHHLEAETLSPGGELLACTRIEPGQAARVWVRGGTWAWGPVVVHCEPPGGDLDTLTFHCDEGASP